MNGLLSEQCVTQNVLSFFSLRKGRIRLQMRDHINSGSMCNEAKSERSTNGKVEIKFTSNDLLGMRKVIRKNITLNT